MTKEQFEIQLRDYKISLSGVTLNEVCQENAVLRKQRDTFLEVLKELHSDCTASDFNEHWQSYKNAEIAIASSALVTGRKQRIENE